MNNMSNTEAEIMSINNAKIVLPYAAATLKAYYDELKNAGFDEKQALELTKGFQGKLFPENKG